MVAFAAPTNVSLSGYPLLLSFLSQFDRGDGNYFIPYDFNNNDLASRFLLQSQDSDLYRVIRFYPENPEMFEVCFIPRPSDQILINFVSHKYSSDTSTYYGFYRSATVVYYSVSVYKFTYNAENGFFVNSMSSLPAVQYLDVYSTSKKIISFIPNDMVTIFTSKIPSSVPNCSATRFLRNADRINEKNEAGKITSQPRSFWPRSRHCPAADRTILRPTRIHYTRRKWPASAGSCHNGITSPYRS